MRLRIATRGSRLSLIQTNMVIEMLRRVDPNLEFEILIVRTTGDVVQDKPLYAIGVKGIFEKEVDLAVLRGDADIAVHSLKDLPSDIHPDLVIAGFPPRDPPFDVVVVREDREPSIGSMAPGSRVGTSSVRRRAFISCVRRDLNVDVVRGNVDTRIRKLLEGQYDALVLAEAGVVRLIRDGMQLPIKIARIPPTTIPPAPGQGIVAAVARRGDVDVVRLLREASDRAAMAEALAERAFLASVGGGCHVPLGGVAVADGSRLKFIAGVATHECTARAIVEVEGPIEDPEHVGRMAAERLLKEAQGIFEELKVRRGRNAF